MSATFFESPGEFRKWLKANHAHAAELLLGLHKKGAGRAGLSYAEALDEALCFGWIDGVRKTVDGDSYTIRFTPRQPRSKWSTVNTKRAEELIALGCMQPAGLRAFQARDTAQAQLYSYEARSRPLAEPYADQLQANPKAWAYFQAQAPSYQRTASWWVMSAKKEETRLRRLATLIADSEAGRRLAATTGRRRG